MRVVALRKSVPNGIGQDKETKMLAQRHEVQYIFGECTALTSQLRKRLRMHESHTACMVYSVFSLLQFKPITDSKKSIG